MPRTFQGRLTLGFISVVSLTLLLVSTAVVIRLDDYFLQQEQQALDSRANSMAAITALLAPQIIGGPIVTLGQPPDQQGRHVLLIRRPRQARGHVRRGRCQGPGGHSDPDVARLGGRPGRGRHVLGSAPGRRPSAARPEIRSPSDPAVQSFPTNIPPWAIEVTLSNPYTSRASTLAQVTGLLIVVGIIAFIVSVAVASFLARRFTTPLRRLTTAARDLEQGELGSRVPTRLAATGAIEISELSRQFNAMADRLEESVAIIRRDRDRSRDFLADVSHELRTPITALRMSNELLSESAGDDPDTRAEFLESSRQQLERLDWLAQNLLELSKLDSGLVLLDLRPDDLRAAVESSVEQAHASANRRGVSLRLSLPPNPVRIRHDPQRIGQVVTNLVHNAIKFTPRGGSVSVELEPDPEGARIVVRDTGVGIDASELPRIFDRFYRGTMANEARGSGSGLGLAIVKSIVDLHAGRISVDSRLGAGTTFTLILPLDPRAVAETPRPSSDLDDRLERPEGAVRPEVADSSPSAAS